MRDVLRRALGFLRSPADGDALGFPRLVLPEHLVLVLDVVVFRLPFVSESIQKRIFSALIFAPSLFAFATKDKTRFLNDSND